MRRAAEGGIIQGMRGPQVCVQPKQSLPKQLWAGCKKKNGSTMVPSPSSPRQSPASQSPSSLLWSPASCHLVLGFPASRTVTNGFLGFKPPSPCDIWSWWAEQTLAGLCRPRSWSQGEPLTLTPGSREAECQNQGSCYFSLFKPHCT